MIESIIRWSVGNRFFVLLATLMLVGMGLYSLKNTPVDAIPDLSDVQVIIKTSFPGQAPQVVEDQVTYPLTTAMLSVPGAVTVRGYSFFGDSFVYVWSTCLRSRPHYRPAPGRNWDRTPPVSAGSTSMPWWIAAVSMTSVSCAACRTGS